MSVHTPRYKKSWHDVNYVLYVYLYQYVQYQHYLGCWTLLWSEQDSIVTAGKTKKSKSPAERKESHEKGNS